MHLLLKASVLKYNIKFGKEAKTIIVVDISLHPLLKMVNKINGNKNRKVHDDILSQRRTNTLRYSEALLPKRKMSLSEKGEGGTQTNFTHLE